MMGKSEMAAGEVLQAKSSRTGKLVGLPNELDEEDFVDLGVESENGIEIEALNYLGGYIAHKYKKTYPSVGFPEIEGLNNDWNSKVPGSESVYESEERLFSTKVKGQFYKSVVRPGIGYGAETCLMKKVQEQEMDVEEVKMLRWMCGATSRNLIRN
ncbi:uncharacterized protein LOC135216609 [Macrobrachium nipponense]|uniref:uncharacterized protein LOC135216609 n=1 Tax=Macrobrachium nipponense TaxID=159736 RepID=UPI0030C8D3CC